MLDLREIPLTAITPSPFQVRKTFDPVTLCELADSLARDGQAQAILVRPVEDAFEIIAGERRWRAKQLVEGATTILAEVRLLSDLQARRLLVAENIQREDLAPLEWIEAVAEMVDATLIEQTAYAALAARPIERVRALLMKLDSDRRHGTDYFASKFTGTIEDLFAGLPKPVEWVSYYTNDLPLICKLPDEVKGVAIAARLSKSQTKALGELHRRAPDAFHEVVQQQGIRPQRDLHERGAHADDIRPLAEVSAREIRLMASNPARRQERHAAVANAIYTTSIETDLVRLIDEGQRFTTVYADPPWPFDNQGTRAATGNHYSTLSLNALAALPVRELVTENAHLHLWTTNAFLEEALALLKAWGFTYSGTFVWVKPQMGLGNYWRNATELLLLGVRGRLLFRDHGLRNWLEVKRGQHSAKPEQVRALIERASPGPYLELFGRRAVSGWTVVGNQIAEAS